MSRHKIILTSISIALLIVLLDTFARAQPDDITAAAQNLTGGASRVWVYAKTISAMGPGGERCTSGRTYHFAKENSALIISECKDGQMIKSRHIWALKQQSPIDVVLTIDNAQSYLLSFKNSSGEHLMRLRANTDSKTVPNTDMEFRLGAD